MAEKTDQEIIEELGLEQDKDQNFDSNEDSLEPVPNNEEQNELTNTEGIDDASQNSDYDNNTIENEDNDEAPVQKKKPKILKLLIAVIAGLSIILTIGTILYLTGFYDDEEVKEETPKAQAIKVEKKPEVDINDIDKNKLNQKLKMLTKTEILDKEELEAEEKRIQEEEQKRKEAEQKALEDEKKKEEEKLAKEKEALEKEKQLLEERQVAIQKEQEEFLKFQAQIKQEFEEQKNQLLKELENKKTTSAMTEVVVNDNNKENSTTNNEEIKEETSTIINNEETQVPTDMNLPIEETPIPSKEDEIMNANLFLPFINVAVIKGDLHKEYLEKIENIDKKISLCRDTKNRIEIYFGPYDSMKERTKVFNTLMESGYKEAYLVDFTKEEYEKRCKY